MRRLAVIAAVGFSLCAVAPATAAPTEDSITGTAQSPFFVSTDFDAHSGPSGEQPSGQVQFHGGGDFTFGGPVTCLNVRGNVATFNLDTIYGIFTAEVTDNAGTGKPDVIRGGGVGPNPAGSCPAFQPGDGLITDQVTSGDIRVVDAQAPKLLTVAPPNGTSGVARDAVVVAIFSELMDKPSAQGAFSLKRTSTGANVPGTFAWYGTALIFIPTSPLTPGAAYTASVTTAAKSAAGWRIAAGRSWQFTATTDGTAPSLLITSPAAGATGVARNAAVVAVFSELMDKPSTQGAFSLRRTSTGATVPGRFAWYGTALIFIPTNPLAAGADYTATVSTAAKDLAGNHLPAARAWGFRTGS